jgi:hypothetical protein
MGPCRDDWHCPWDRAVDLKGWTLWQKGLVALPPASPQAGPGTTLPPPTSNADRLTEDVFHNDDVCDREPNRLDRQRGRIEVDGEGCSGGCVDLLL